VNLDLYRDDARDVVVFLSSTRVGQLSAALADAASDVEVLAADRVALASALTSSYESVVKLLSILGNQPFDPRTNQNVVTARQYLAEYQAAVEKQRQETRTRIDAAARALDEYVKKRDSADPATASAQTKALQAFADVSRALARMGGSLGTDFEVAFVNQWAVVVRSVASSNLRALTRQGEPAELEEVRRKVTQLGEQLEGMRARGRRVPQAVARTLSTALKETQLEPARLKSSFDKVAAAMTEVPVSLGLDDRGSAALHDLVVSTTFLFSQIDRVQDPADPVWRIITAPENQGRWNTTFSETYFYSEGNNSVVLVRDTPASFRIQRGNNNPAALIQGQLQISRAIANAAIAVAGAAAGVPVPKLPGAGGAASPVGADGSSADAELATKRKTAIDRKAAVHAAALSGLRRQIVALRGELERATNQAAVDEVLGRIRSVLDVYATTLAPK
jgi:hypothetical protein